MGSTAFLLIVLLIAILLWLDGARAREIASSVADALCRKRGYQLLDETVARTRFGLVHTSGGIRLRRVFQFEYSIEGYGRKSGHLLMHGSQVVDVDIAETDQDEPDALQTTHAGEQKKRDDNVIPFRKRH